MNPSNTSVSFRPCDLRVMALLKGFVFIMESRPLLSWKISSDRTGFRQSAYRILAASDKTELLAGNADLWDSGRVESDRSLYVEWGGKELASRQHVCWQVTVWDENGMESEASEIAEFEIALQHNAEWEARWIHFDGNNPACSSPSPYFRHEFSCGKEIAKARLYVTARGLFEARINGKRIGNDYFVPGWTDFSQQIQYMSYDVTGSLKSGNNTIGAILGDGWYCGYLSGRRRNLYGAYPEFLARLEILYKDGTSEAVTSGEGWKTATGPILYSDIYDGEMYDSRLEMPGWDDCGFDDSAWRDAVAGEHAAESPALVQKCCFPVRKIMEIPAVKLLRPRTDVCIWDFGQNISGWVRIKVKGYPGRLFTIRFGEMLNQDGTLYNLNYRSARSTDYYTTSGPLEQEFTWEPRFTFHGFRYAQVDGFQFSGSPDEIEVTAIVLHSELETTGSFECGQPKVNQLYSNICWGQRDNFFEVPTDCPQRDERLGWTGDAEVFCAAAAFNMNVAAFFRKWLRDQREAQFENGSGTHIAPNIFESGVEGSPAWADALVICPWTMYQRYGDESFLTENYESMKRWIEFQKTTSDNLIRPDLGFGDWLSLDDVKTPRPLIGTAYFSYTAHLVAETARSLGRAADAAVFEKLSKEVAEAFRREFVGADGLMKTRNQTSCVLALHFDLLTPEQREKQIRLLEQLIRNNGNRLSTGFVGTASLMLALTNAGLTLTAYDLLLQEEYPSWLFSVNQGATTVWERWNSYTVKDGFGDVNMNSFNHYAYGAVAEWMGAVAGGISHAAPGGRELLFAAIPDPRMGYVKASLETPYGKASSFWKYEEEHLCWQITAPANTSVKVLLPVSDPAGVKQNGAPLSGYERKNGSLLLSLPCGSYTFEF